MSVIIDGGWVMIALLICSLSAVSIILQKLIIINETKVKQSFIQSVIERIMVEKVDVVKADLNSITGVTGKITLTCLNYSSSSDDILEYELNKATKVDRERLESRLSVLSIIITVAPVLGLLGTVIGLMDVFSVISIEGTGQAEQLSAGISKALITTVTGLSLAIPLMFIFQYLQTRINTQYESWDDVARQLIPICKQRGRNEA